MVKWTYSQTPAINSPWEKSFYTAKEITDIKAYWADKPINNSRSIRNK